MTSQKERLLVVDDDENNRDMLSRRLVRQGYAVEVAEDGAQAMDKINAAQYDLVLLDQMMPGMSGLDLLRLLRATYSPSELPVIMVTAMDQNQTVVEALKGGANDYVTKPVDMPLVSARIEAQLSRSRAERQIRESEQRHALAARSGSDGYWDVNLLSGEIYVAPEWITFLGYHPGEIGTDGDSWMALVHPEDVELVSREFASLLENRLSEVHYEHRVRRKNGTYVWVGVRGSILRTAAGKPLRLAGSFTDLTPLKFVDALTGLGNRAALLDRLGEILAAKDCEPARRMAIILLDLNRLKLVVDGHGDGVGDRILREVGHRIGQAVSESNFAGAPISRIDGDEFTVLLPNVSSAIEVTALSENILAQLGRPIPFNGTDFVVQASIGVVIEPIGKPSGKPEDILGNAELAMQRSKELGRNRCQIFEPEMRERASTRIALIRDLRSVAACNQLFALYQPKVNIQSRRIVGFEALLRWRHPERGVLSPLEFIPLAEECGPIIEIGEWILREASRQLVTWQRAFPHLEPMSMNVNLSVKQLADPGLINRIKAVLRDTGIPPRSLKLELTESALMTEIDSARGVLSELQGMGIGLKLDDFGTGYSSLSYLRTLHFDSLKIDRSFTAKMTVDPETHAIVETIIKLAHTLGMTVVAEGIEEEAQLDELLRLKCDTGQGYYFSRPVDAAAAERLWTTNPFRVA